jgi:hypothetical protein
MPITELSREGPLPSYVYLAEAAPLLFLVAIFWVFLRLVLACIQFPLRVRHQRKLELEREQEAERRSLAANMKSVGLQTDDAGDELDNDRDGDAAGEEGEGIDCGVGEVLLDAEAKTTLCDDESTSRTASAVRSRAKNNKANVSPVDAKMSVMKG